MAKILIVDQFSQEAQEQIRAAGHTVVYDTAAKGAKLTEKIAAEKPAVLVVRSTKVEAAQLDAGLPELRMVIRAGSGVDTIDVAGAKTRGIKVCNCPGKNAVAVAELAFGLMMAIDRRIVENVVQFRAGQWNKEAFTECRGLKGRTLGLVGCGNIGKEIAKRAIAFDMHVIVYDPFLQPAQIEAIGCPGCSRHPRRCRQRRRHFHPRSRRCGHQEDCRRGFLRCHAPWLLPDQHLPLLRG
eukprot:EC838700.1.p1 GENE.EC838700.1~~EC838700.1.p1  ORF type:complete len:240 (+),score=51.56 EC838700.1:1-720(+)